MNDEAEHAERPLPEPADGPHPAAGPGETPERDGAEFICEICGSLMLERHCKIVCPVCGYQRDCSDP